MPIAPHRVLSAVIVGDDAHTALVDLAPLRTRARRGPTLKGFLSAPVEDLRRALPPEAAGRELVLTVPSSACGVRSAGVGAAQWNGARAEIHRSIGKMFPISPEEALLGFVARAPRGAEAEESAGGYLIVAQREAVRPHVERLREIAGPESVRLLAPQMAILGLGYQRLADVGVLDAGPTGAPVIHRLRRGRVVGLAEPWDPEASDAAAVGGLSLWRLPRGMDDADPSLRSIAAIDPHDLAVAAALAPRVGGGEIAPLDERATPAPNRWLFPLAATAAAIALVWGAASVREARLERGVDRVARQEERLQAEFAEAQRLRQELDRLRARVRAGVIEPTSDWRPILPALADAEAVVPTSGFVYSLDVSPERVLIRGEAPLASDVLRGLEETDRFRNAAFQDPTSDVAERNAESFHLRADRADKPAPDGGSP
jgi:hypothetical protein